MLRFEAPKIGLSVQNWVSLLVIGLPLESSPLELSHSDFRNTQLKHP